MATRKSQHSMSNADSTDIAAKPEPGSAILPFLYRRITLRLIPFLILLYLIAFLDRVNTSFAALTMNPDLGISDSVFGIGAGIFFLGYLLFEVPSNFMLVKVGARPWIATLMVVWGFLSVGLAFVHSGTVYIALRFLLGAAEAGFFPGVVLYLTFWFPASRRGTLMALFIVAIPLSTILGAPLSVAILGMNGIAHLKGWQWLFLIEGSLAILIGAIVPLVLENGPSQAKWLSQQERAHLAAAISAESQATQSHPSWLSLLRSRHILCSAAAYFTLMVGLYGLSFWIPRILALEGAALAHLGWTTAIPYLLSAVGMTFWCRHSDRSGERTWHLVLAFLAAALGMYIASVTHLLIVSLAGFSLAALGIFSAMPLFWTHVTQRLSLGAAIVAGIAVVNAIGNCGGFVGPVLMGSLLDHTHSFSSGLLAISLTLVAGAMLIYYSCQHHDRTSG